MKVRRRPPRIHRFCQAPSLHGAGLTVLGIDTCFPEGCDLIADRVDLPSSTGDVRDPAADALTGLVRRAPRRRAERSLGDLDAHWTNDVNLTGTVSLLIEDKLLLAHRDEDSGPRWTP
jgi:hypothetical protein